MAESQSTVSPEQDNADNPVVDVADKEVSQSDTPKAAVNSESTTSLVQVCIDRALQFLSTASNETLGACLVGLGASTYLLLGRVGLVIIGVAGGVVLQATWDGSRRIGQNGGTKAAEVERRREAGIEVAQRILQWRAITAPKENDNDIKVLASQAFTYDGKFGAETTSALETFTDHVIKDYVHYWYDPAVPNEESFPAACRRVFTAFVLSLSAHLQRKRPADAFLDFVTNSSSIIIVFLSELSAALNASPNSTAEEAIDMYLRAKPDSSLSYMMNEESQARKLADAAEDVLQAYLDPKAYNCAPVHVFLKEVFAQLVLGATITSCSRPEWINEWIVYGLEESETTKEVMNIVDAGVEGGTRKQTKIDVTKSPTKQDASIPVPVRNEDTATNEHKRTMSRAEVAMDEAMREARRLTELMIAEDERRAKEELEKQATVAGAEDHSDSTTQDELTPPSSRQSEHDLSLEPTEHIPDTVDEISHNNQSEQGGLSYTASSPVQAEAAVLTLHNATISIFDDSNPGERTSIKAKPTTDYLIQIEPPSSAFAGWMIARKYADFETLHEVLRRISVITGVDFTKAHAELPKWKTHTKASLRNELERYLTDAVRYQPLAESEGMKRFLEKERGFTKSPGGGMKGFGWPTPDAFGKLGGDMMNVLTKAPKQVAGGVTGGGKAVFGGVAGLVGANKKTATLSQSNLNRSATSLDGESPASPAGKIRPGVGHAVAAEAAMGSTTAARASQESLRSFQPPALERRGSAATTVSTESKVKPDMSSTRPNSILSRTETAPTSVAETMSSPSASQCTPRTSFEEFIHLPPPPSEMPEDYSITDQAGRASLDTSRSGPLARQSVESDGPPPALPTRPSAVESKPKEPLTERETSVAIELMFAVIVELYTLSSAWQIRRTLLTAAKSFLLRPGNPQLLSVRDLLQTSLLDSNLSDSGMAASIRKLRENGLPTVEELEIWERDYPEKNADEKEELRKKARRLLVSRGMPAALTSVMGAAASGEALGKVFDCLQIPRVSRGLVFGLMLQALRVVTH